MDSIPTMAPFVNTLPYISSPIEEFKDYQFVNWEKDIYPTFKDGTKKAEIDFFCDFISENRLKNILDLGVGGGIELGGIILELAKRNYAIQSAEANELHGDFIQQASAYFNQNRQSVLIHQANWLDLPKAAPEYSHAFDFAFLTGNALPCVGGGTREYALKMQQQVVSNFAQMIQKGGYLFIDTRNYDYIKTLVNQPIETVRANFKFGESVYYHGFETKIKMFPGYISETVVVFHYYDTQKRIWSTFLVSPICQKEMLQILGKDFVVEKVFHDFKEVKGTAPSKSLFVQYLARKK